MRNGIIFGTFDLLHSGHIHLFKQCKKLCDKLIVGIHVDPSKERKNKNKPIELLLERQIKVNACRYVDFTFCYETEAELILALMYFKVDVRFLGSDYEGRLKTDVTEPELVPIEIIKSLPIHTSDIRKRL